MEEQIVFWGDAALNSAFALFGLSRLIKCDRQAEKWPYALLCVVCVWATLVPNGYLYLARDLFLLSALFVGGKEKGASV